LAFKKKIRSESKYFGLRDSYLLKLASDRSVIHVGCTDWPFTQENCENGTLLHLKLKKVSSSLLGIDKDLAGLSYLRKIIPGEYELGDLLENDMAGKFKKYDADIIFVPDVLEHVPNQKDFLKGCLDLAKLYSADLVLTTPNQYSIKAFLGILVGLDFTHSDHRVIHNRFTLETSLADLDVATENITLNYVSRDIRERYGVLLSLISRGIDGMLFLKPYLADSIVILIKNPK